VLNLTASGEFPGGGGGGGDGGNGEKEGRGRGGVRGEKMNEVQLSLP